MKLFSFDNPIVRFLDMVANIIFINLLFILFSLPLFTIGASITAMDRCFLSLTNGKEDGLFALFLSSFKVNFKKSTIIFFLSLPLLIISIYEALLSITGTVSNINSILFMIPFFVISCFLSYVYPLQAQFENKISVTIKNAFLLSITHIPTTIFITAINLIFPITVYFFPELFIWALFPWILFGFSLCAFFCTTLLRKIFMQFFPK